LIHQKSKGEKTMLNQEQIGTYIAARRKAVGLTQAELGERFGITAQSVSNWERGVSLR
jgi:transcriptional regulator with XRE-family HTH domain